MTDFVPEFFFLDFIHIKVVSDFVFLVFQDFVELVDFLVHLLLLSELLQLIQFEESLMLFGKLLEVFLELLVLLFQAALFIQKLLKLLGQRKELKLGSLELFVVCKLEFLFFCLFLFLSELFFSPLVKVGQFFDLSN